MLRIDRSLYVYKSRRGEQAELKLKIKDICQTRVRYGYRRVHVLIRRDGWGVNPKRIYRLYKEMGLQLRHKTPKRRVKAKLRADRAEPTHSNDVWAMDFVHDQLATGRKIRVLTVVDTFSDGRQEISTQIRTRLSVNTAEAAVDAASAGLGITRVMAYQARRAVQAGQLVPLLEDFELEPSPVQLVHLSQALMPLKLRIFLDFAAPRLRATLS